MKRIFSLSILLLLLIACNNKHKELSQDINNQQENKHDYGLFSIWYPSKYNAEVDTLNNHSFSLVIIDSMGIINTRIQWSTSNIFPSTSKDMATVFVYQEMKDYKGKFYDIMETDSTFLIDGFPTYSISSIYTEGVDTFIQSRTALVIQNQFDMMIIQRTKTKESNEYVEEISKIIESITINDI